jgi:predicted AlkP superfamily phosphohydrolase/phosphomutase
MRVPLVTASGSRVSRPLRCGIAVVVCFALLAGACAGRRAPAHPGHRVVVLGFDGMDYALTSRMMAAGRLPNLARLAREGGFSALGTSLPPQSPVAWSDFITGSDAGRHGIFDFIHRDPRTMEPYLSTSKTVGPGHFLRLGKWQIPLAGGRVELLRRGEPFWEVLERHGVRTTVVRIPANFPPSGTATRELSGMGTPDLLGTYGTYSFYTSAPRRFEHREMTGKVYEALPIGNVVEAFLKGPPNPFVRVSETLEAPFSVYLDPERAVAKLVVGEEQHILVEGEWSDWVPLTFTMVPTQPLHAMARFYLKRVRPTFELYVSPLNVDPIHPALPISTPASFAATLAHDCGRFYTQGMPEDTKALSEGILDRREFLAQAHLAEAEVEAQYRYVLAHFSRGLLFYYFGNGDQTSHMMWRSMDPDHPAYDRVRDAPFADVIPHLYEEFDRIVGYTLQHVAPETSVVVMSDHGFTSWRRSFHLNAWLARNGYLRVSGPARESGLAAFSEVDWRATEAYGLGINGLYINLEGRERGGIVSPERRTDLMTELAEKLEALVDPDTGQRAILHVYRRDRAYQGRGALQIGPDLVIGYANGYRCSNESALGDVGREIFTDNTDAWSGDHCMDPSVVPGILATNRRLRKPVTKLSNLAAALLAEFGIEDFPPKTGGE